MNIEDLMDIAEFVTDFPKQLGVAPKERENESLHHAGIRRHFNLLVRLLDAYEDLIKPEAQILLCGSHSENWFCDRDKLSSKSCVVCAHESSDDRPQPSRDALEVVAEIDPIVSHHRAAKLLLMPPSRLMKLMNAGGIRSLKTSESKHAPRVLLKRDVALLLTQIIADSTRAES